MAVKERKSRIKKKQEILESARKLIEQKGYEDITMEDIAATVSLSRPALYLYFKNKAEIYLALVTRGLQELNEGYDRALSRLEGVDPVDTLKAAGIVFFEFYGRNHAYFDLLVTKRADLVRESGVDLVEEFERAGRGAVQPIARAYESGVDSGHFRKKNPEKMAYMLRAVAIGIAVGFREGNLRFPDDVELVTDMVMNGMLQP
ncbi:MAG: TetR/AcrR family transcriptional regulator [Leptospiraceae bacterium]|nr:TetR/AcrR family transcriptional regulator [Leptospiraceae bacterium]MCB1303501.1 TetR/AcrR family transcriptional regulator [Leptospiraceae bacterium]